MQNSKYPIVVQSEPHGVIFTEKYLFSFAFFIVCERLNFTFKTVEKTLKATKGTADEEGIGIFL